MRIRLAPFDLIWAFAAPVIALALRNAGLLEPGDFPTTIRPAYQFALVTTAMAIPAFIMFRLSEGMSRFVSVRDVLAVCAAVAVTIASSSVALFMLNRLEGLPRSTPVICGLVMIAGLLFVRMIARVFHEEEWSGGVAPATSRYDAIRRRVILVGVDRFAAIAIKLIDSQRPRSTVIVATLDPRPNYAGRTIGGVKIVGDVSDFNAVVEEYAVHGVDIDEVWICDDATLSPSARAHLQAECSLRGLPLLLISEALNLAPLPIVSAPAPAAQEEAPNDYFWLKRALDVVASSLMLIALLPIFLLVATLTLVDVGAPVLFWQQRVGLNGRKFLLYKFRTLQAPFDARGIRIPSENRLSRVGRALRATRLDELPQLINVLVGDMSLIGPRPLLPQDQPLDPSIRLTVRPGITGWAQVNGGTIVTADEKNALDTWYVRHASLALDLRILVNTLRFLVTGEKLNSTAVQEAIHDRSGSGAIEGPHPFAGARPPTTPTQPVRIDDGLRA